MNIGLIGIGTMGSSMARNLVKAGHEVIGRDIDPGAERRALDIGVTVVKSPAQVAMRTEIILMSLPMPSDVESVVCGEDGILSAVQTGSVIADLSTVDPFSTQRNAARAAEKGVAYLDAPVLGRPQRCGYWTLPVGGDKNAVEKCRGVLEVLAQRVIHVGPSGHGNIVKVLNNMMFGAINAVTAEIMAAQRVASVRRTLPNYGALHGLFGELFGYLGSRRIRPAGPGMAIYHDPEFREHDVDVEAAVPVVAALPEDGPVKGRELPEARMACVVYQGAYEGIGEAYNAIMAWLEPNGYRVAGPVRENYLCSPGDTSDPARYVTEIQVPVEKA